MKLKTNNFIRQMETSDFEEKENKQLIFSVADEVPYLRNDEAFGPYYEVLQISEKAIDTTRLVKNMPFLKDHDHSSQLGAVKKFWIDENQKKLYVSVKFSRSRFAQSIKEDIIDMIRQNTSIGYFVNEFKNVGTSSDGIPILRAVSWVPYECSSVSVPASVFVGYNRSLQVKEQKGIEMNEQYSQNDNVNELATKTKQLETKDINGQLENKDLVREAGKEEEEGTSKEPAEGTKEEEKEKQLKQVCPECGKDPCECEGEKTTKQDKETKECGKEPEKKDLEVKKITIDDLISDQDKVKIQIRALGRIYECADKAEDFIKENRSLDQFKNYLKNGSEQSKNSIQDINKMNKKYFSIVHAIRNAGNLNKGDFSQDYETQVVFENKRNLNIDDADIVLTNAELYQTRALGPTSGKGAELINTDYLPGEFVPFDRPQLTIDKVGSYAIPSNGNPISFTQCISGATAAMYGLDGELSAGDMDFVLKTMTPHKAGVNIPIPYSLLLEGRPDIDSLVQADVVNALYQKRDEQVWTGTGANNQVAGIANLTGINVITGASISGGAAWGAMLSGVGEIRKANIFNENISYVMNTDTYTTLKKTMKDTNNCFAGFIIGDDDRIGKYPVYVNNALPANTVLVGVGSDIAVTDFRGLGILVDPYTYSNKQALKITAWMSFDMVLRRLKSWTKITLTA